MCQDGPGQAIGMEDTRDGREGDRPPGLTGATGRQYLDGMSTTNGKGLEGLPLPDDDRVITQLSEAARDMRLIAKAHEKGWHVPDHMRRKCLLECEAVLDLPEQGHSAPLRVHQVKLLAVRTLALLDAIDVRRESNSIVARGQELDAQTGALRDLLASPEGRRKLAGLTEGDAPQVLPAPARPEPDPPTEHK